MRSVYVALLMAACFLQSSCDFKSTNTELSPYPIDKKAARVFSRKYMGAIPCERDALIEFIQKYASTPSVQKAFTRDPVKTKHVSLNDEAEITYGEIAADKLSSTYGFSREYLAYGQITKRVNDQTFEVEVQGDSRLTHTFSHDTVCWYYESLTDRSEDACHGLPQDECIVDTEDDMEGLDHD